MKVIVYGLREDEKEVFPQEAAIQHVDITVTTEMLNSATVTLAKGHDAIIIVTACKITDAIAKELSEYGIRYILTRSTGYDHIDSQAIRKYGIRAANVPVYSVNAVPEYTVMLILNLIRNFKTELRKLDNRDYTLSDIQGRELGSMTLGLFGTGLLGCQSIRMLNAMGSKILACDPYPREEAKQYVTYTTKEEIFRNSDLIFFHCNLTENTRQLINQETIRQMKDRVYLVNTARGGLMNFIDVLEGLKSGKIAGLATDVYDNESVYFRKNCEGITFDDPVLEELLQMDQVILTPHIAFYTDTSIHNLIKHAIENALAFYTEGACKNEIYKYD
ncbi:NAD(P)-dependent oxidoreductase [Clostridium transplantifaecale]|uniref:NAD(P)-dependent oxidoreductase n=1 Tax=Clostridium transplantifaecale TaxID=2479838 RepID=UPI000F637599|nr:NAD(P)-dependent oxidoreductase [Clostridium transplantifaecale]